MKSYCIVFFFAIVKLVVAQSNTSPFYITNPLPGTVLKAGDSIDLEWNNGLDQTVNVVVIQGHDSGTMKATDISFDVEGDDGSYTFQIPKTLADAGTYAFQLEYKDKDGLTQYAYSGPVYVSGGSGTIAPSATATTPAAVRVISSPPPSPSPSSVMSSPIISGSPSASASLVSASLASASSKNTSSAKSTLAPNSSSGIKVIGFVMVIPALLMVTLSA